MLKHYNIFFGNMLDASVPFIKLHETDLSFKMDEISSLTFCEVASPNSYPTEGPGYTFIAATKVEEIEHIRSVYKIEILELNKVIENLKKEISLLERDKEYYKSLNELI